MITAFYNEKRLELSNLRGILLEFLFISTAVFAPRIIHLAGGVNAGQIFLPMHWMVLLSAIVFGWRGGLISAIAIPSISYIYSGMPVSFLMPAIYMELLIYGLVFGLLREKIKINVYFLLFISLIAGRFVLFTGVKTTQLFLEFPGFLSLYSKGFIEFASIYFQKGLISGILQLALIPTIALLMTRNIDNN